MVRVGVILGTYNPGERQRRKALIESYRTPDIDVEVLEVPADPYGTDLTGGVIAMITPSFIEVARKAERDGFDAVVPFGTLDIGVEAARSFLDIPIIGPLEAGLRLAGFLGDKIGMITYTKHASLYQVALGRWYGLEDRIVGTKALDISLRDIAENEDTIRAGFVSAAEELKERGAEVIIPAGVTLCPVWMTAESLSQDIGLPVVECVGAPIRVAALLAQSRLEVSRQRFPKAPEA